MENLCLANESGDNDPFCVGGPTNFFLVNRGLSIVIAKPNSISGEFLSLSFDRWQNWGRTRERKRRKKEERENHERENFFLKEIKISQKKN